MASLGATAVISTSVPMRNWARLTVTDADAGLDAGGEAGRAMGMIAQAVKNGIQASRKRTARRCIGSESSKVQRECHGTRVRSPNGVGSSGGWVVAPSRLHHCTTSRRHNAFCYNVAAMKPYVLKRGPDSPAEPKFSLDYEGELNPGQLAAVKAIDGPILVRSEEHTSELQSPCNLVCRLLLEKKK